MGKPKYLELNLSLCHFVLSQIPHEMPEIEPWPLHWEVHD